MQMELDGYQLILDVLDDVAPVAKLNFQALLANYGSVDFRLQGTGYAALVSLLVRALTYKTRQKNPEKILSEFNESKESPKKNEEPEEKPSDEPDKPAE